MIDGSEALDGPDTKVARATLAAQVEEAIRFDILSGALEPGKRLRASELSDRYGVSATPLREALQRLAAQNLVELGPRLGATVSPISVNELEDIYHLREVLETIALERSIKFGDELWVANVNRTFEAFQRITVTVELVTSTGVAPSRADTRAWSSAHRAFHDSTYEACGSPWLLRFVATLSDHSERYRMLSWRSGVRQSLAEHPSIREAVIARDTAAALDLLRRHLSSTVELLEYATTGSVEER